ncbi:hypothetical protein HNY73_004581 [Argiope bruennichi]|uniref:Uncharacterized protein n=1 Tax=Argiope bruennichi TaxID=94029 RepID=A0A8T0FR19_ARGBR|nr:hypothetical protein HNY73_004581 [Argiope bruennichi]
MAPVSATQGWICPPTLYQLLPKDETDVLPDAQTESGDLQRPTCDSIFCRVRTFYVLATPAEGTSRLYGGCACFFYLFGFRSFLVLYLFGVLFYARSWPVAS